MAAPSPILFNAVSPSSVAAPSLDVVAREEHVARRLSRMGFVEVEVPQSPTVVGKRRSTSRRDKSPDKLPTPLDDSGSDESDSSSAPEDEESRPARKRVCHDVEITVEYIPPSTSPTISSSATTTRRVSRRWVREKKGKRWVEDDYNQILEALRRL